MLRLAAAFTGGFLLLAVAAFWLTTPALACSGTAGKASWYGFEHDGRKTASGAVFDQWAMTAAMPNRSELGRVYRVTHAGKSVVVRITDVGPHKRLGRVIDLSRGAAAKLGMIEAGVGRVCLERIQ